MAVTQVVQYYGTGRRKSAIARVFLRPGTGGFTVNSKPHDVYFVTEQQRISAKKPLALTELTGSFDVVTTVRGGGVAAQADAVKMGISRALLEFNIELRKTLKAEGLLTPRCAHQGAQEVRPEGRPQALPVQQALVLREAVSDIHAGTASSITLTVIRGHPRRSHSEYPPLGDSIRKSPWASRMHRTKEAIWPTLP